ncbi:hypothetical protein [Streptomyces sp. NBC_00358]|jgi:hypothetical protein|uniref:hypothetical protein n=1 Tax=Streptomyces sp. NBC_00358 TaxID=2975725 RepID=UPI002E25773C
MDDGKATLLAGIAALVGTLASAIAAWLAARFGARQGIETARAQVAAQRSADWEHWAREQRSQVLLNVLDQVATVDSALGAASVKLALGQMPGNELHDQYLEAHRAMLRNALLLGVWGPDEARAICQTVYALAVPIYDSWCRWEGATSGGLPIDAHSDAFHSRRRAFHEQRGKLIDITKQALREPKEGDS